MKLFLTIRPTVIVKVANVLYLYGDQGVANNTETYVNIAESLTKCCLSCCQHKRSEELDFLAIEKSKDF